MNQLYMVGFLVLAVAIATFAIQNSGEAVVKFIGWQFHSSLEVVVLISTAAGVMMASISVSPRHISSANMIARAAATDCRYGVAPPMILSISALSTFTPSRVNLTWSPGREGSA